MGDQRVSEREDAAQDARAPSHEQDDTSVVTGLLGSTPSAEHAASVLRAHPSQQRAIMSVLHATRGNGFVQQVLSILATAEQAASREAVTEPQAGEGTATVLLQGGKLSPLEDDAKDPITQESLGKAVAAHARKAPRGIRYGSGDDYMTDSRFKLADRFTWHLKPGQSASAALKAFHAGPTICDCGSAMVSFQWDAIRQAIGDAKFDAHFGAEGGGEPDRGYLVIGGGGLYVHRGDKRERAPLTLQHPNVGKTAAGGAGTRSGLNVGDWYYFSSFQPSDAQRSALKSQYRSNWATELAPYFGGYRARHPHEPWEGENAAYLGVEGGEQRWGGFGLENLTERQIMEEIVKEYNAPGLTPADDQVELTGELKIRHLKTGWTDPESGLIASDRGYRIDVDAVRELAK